MTFTLDLETLFKVTAHPDQNAGEVWTILDLGERIHDQYNDLFLHNSAMTLVLDLETWFKVTAHPLPKSNLWVKHEPTCTKEKENMLQTSDLGRTDRLQITIGCLLTEALIKKCFGPRILAPSDRVALGYYFIIYLWRRLSEAPLKKCFKVYITWHLRQQYQNFGPKVTG